MSTMFRTLLCSFLASASVLGSAWAGIEQAPPSFPHETGNAVYVDFESIEARIVYDVATKKTSVESEVAFQMPAAGYPIFDLIENPSEALLDGTAVATPVIQDPKKVTRFRVADRLIQPGVHRMSFKHGITRNVSYQNGAVASAFWMSDLDDRQYLEQYLPASFEYDSFSLKLNVEVRGADANPHVVRANGTIRSPSRNVFEIEFPSFYTVSSVFFHVLPETAAATVKFDYTSVDGRTIPVVIYGKQNEMNSFTTDTKRILAELEGDYGPFPHNQVVIYGAGSGGMEYSGATMTSLWALGHELKHSYNARSVMPANGNAGWIDEAIASWRDDGYQVRTTPSPVTTMAGHTPWTRMTDYDAYSDGEEFIRWMAGKLRAAGKEMKTFLRGYYAKYAGSTVTTEVFSSELEGFSGLALQADFDKYVYGKKSADEETSPRPKRTYRENPYHPRLTEEQLQKLLWPSN